LLYKLGQPNSRKKRSFANFLGKGFPLLTSRIYVLDRQTRACSQARKDSEAVLGVWCPASQPLWRCRLVGARFGRWREETLARARCLTLRYSLPLSVWVDPLAEHLLAFTRYCFTSRLLCTNQSSLYRALSPAPPALLQYYCTSICAITTPPRPPFCMAYSIQYWQLQYRVKAKAHGTELGAGQRDLSLLDLLEQLWRHIAEVVDARRPVGVRTHKLKRKKTANLG